MRRSSLGGLFGGDATGQGAREAVEVMRELGIDISPAVEAADGIRGQKFDFVITVCDRAREECPVFGGELERLHWPFGIERLLRKSEGSV